ncbi:MAG: 3-carboxymuconate cyclase, partial [Akkermansiaceae bacterium]|nr:3-carboxymuconate cyclase [Akkermansiaceae bacterium]
MRFLSDPAPLCLSLLALFSSPAQAVISPPVYESVYAFASRPEDSPDTIQSSMVRAPDGSLYGTSSSGGRFHRGSIYRISTAGELTLLHSFGDGEGSAPNGLMLASDGNFYGTTSSGGYELAGTVYKITPGGVFTVLKSFNGGDGSRADSALAEGPDGQLYGITNKGGTFGGGTFFRISKSGDYQGLTQYGQLNGPPPSNGLTLGSDGYFYSTLNAQSGVSSVVRFDRFGNAPVKIADLPASYSRARLIQGSDGKLYGTTATGGSSQAGTVFSVTPTGVFTPLASLGGIFGTNPLSELVEAPDGSFYGTTSAGGVFQGGAIYCISPAGQISAVSALPGQSATSAGLTVGADGQLYGATSAGGLNQKGALFKISMAREFSVVADLGSTSVPNLPTGISQSPDGSLYGTTLLGGPDNVGTFFKIDSAGAFQQRMSFSGIDGVSPQVPLVQLPDGNYYTATNTGSGVPPATGSVIRIVPSSPPSGAGSSIFAGFDQVNGWNPNTLLAASDGNLYGTSLYGGATHQGNIFKVTPAGVVTNVLSFTPSVTTAPVCAARLVQARDGNLYAITLGNGGDKTGVILKRAASGAFTPLVRFTAPGASGAPGDLIQGVDGFYYGTSPEAASGLGIVFRLTLAGVFTVRATLPEEHLQPVALVQAGDGNFYGTTRGFDPDWNQGSIFKMTPGGVVSTVVNFNWDNGSFPNNLRAGTDGNLYGVTQFGGTGPDGLPGGGGQIFRLRFGPAVTGQSATVTNWSAASVRATVDSRSKPTTVSLQYGTTADFTGPSLTTVALTSYPAGKVAPVDCSLTGLTAKTTYYYRILAANADNAIPQSGGTLSFTTPDFFGGWLLVRGLTSGPDGDDDHDGLTNFQEYAQGTDP